MIVVADTLAMLTGEETVRELRQYCPDSRIVALVDYSDKVGRLLDAGAALIYTRRVPPADVAAGISTLLAA